MIEKRFGFEPEIIKYGEAKAKTITRGVTLYCDYLPVIFVHKDLSLDFIRTDGVGYTKKQHHQNR